ncbi:hypothetical protein NX059_008685 [Plenodomus lindquistii]|nr:hypothetical protein NX059_008685 [Plenodomus lindquistii]
MLPHTAMRALGAAAFLFPIVSAHMQMLIPSPLRDPNSNRKDEPKDYNILTPLHADGSDFACKGYQWNTPWTSVATYEAGNSYKMTLKGSATHGGGSCQLSLSCDGGVHFKVIKSIIGGCPMEKQYPFTIPPEFAKSEEATCLFAWTWFNKIGNREMYMNCAVVTIVPNKRKGGRRPPSTPNTPMLKGRDVSRANAAAQSLLAGYPDLFVANLKNVNSCTIKETVDAIFDNPGRAVSFGDGASESSSPSFKRGMCTGAGLSSADSSAYSSTSSTGGWKESKNKDGGQDWMWQGGDSSGQSKSEAQGDDGMWHGESQTGHNGGNNGQWQGHGQASWNTPIAASTNNKEQMQANLSPVDLNEMGQRPDARVQSDLDAYLAKLYSKQTSNRKREAEAIDKTSFQNDETSYQSDDFIETDGHNQANIHGRIEDPSYSADDSEESYYDMNKRFLHHGTYAHRRRTTRKQRWNSYNQRRDPPSSSSEEDASNTDRESTSEAAPESDTTTENHQGAALVFVSPPSKSDLAYYAILAKLNSMSSTVFTLIKFASTYLDGPPPPERYIFAAVSPDNGTVTTLKKRTPMGDSDDKASLRAELLKRLNRLQTEVFKLTRAAKTKMAHSGTWSKVKRYFTPPVWTRQLIIPGIIPAAMQNYSSPFYFAEPMSNGSAYNKAHHSTHNSSEPHAVLEEALCTFNLSLIDRCMSSPTFLSTIPSDNDTAPTTANLLDALQICASVDIECEGNKESLREDRLAPMNDNCQGIFMTISHCLLDDKGTKRAWNTLPLSNLTTLENTPFRESLYTCVQENLFCAPDMSSEMVNLTPFNPLTRCNEEDLKCQLQALAYAAQLASEMEKQNRTESHYYSEDHTPAETLMHCAKTDLGCIAHAKLQDLKYAALSGHKVNWTKRQTDDGIEEPGAAESLIPVVSHDALDDGLEEQDSAQPYDWDSIYTDTSMGSDDGGRVPAVVGAQPVQNWPLASEEAVNANSPSAEAVYTGEREPPVVGTKPVQNWTSPSEGQWYTPTPSKIPVYPNGRDTLDIEPSVVGSKPIQSWPPPSEDPVYTDERLPPVVGPSPVSQWPPRFNLTMAPPNITAPIQPAPDLIYPPPFQLSNSTTSLLGTAIPTPSQTAIPAPYNSSSSGNNNMTLGEALKLAFPELINHPPLGEPVDQPPRYTQPQEEENVWRDGVFPGLVGVQETEQAPATQTHTQSSANATPTANDEDIAAILPFILGPGPVQLPATHTHSSKTATPTANDEDIAAILPFILGPGPVQPPGITGVWPSTQETPPSTPDNLEHMPQVINDLTPEDEESIRNFFSELAAQSRPKSSATPVSAGNLETMPALVNDLDEEDEADVRAFFSSLSASVHAYATPSPSPTPSSPSFPHHPHAPRHILASPSPSPTPVPVPASTQSSCAAHRATLRTLLETYRTALRAPCNTEPYVAVSGAQRVQMTSALEQECKAERKRMSGAIGVVMRGLEEGCEGAERLFEGVGV